MTRYMLVFLSALLLAVGGTPLAKRLALRLGIIDQPSARKVHKSPTPLLGGVAIYIAAIIALVVYDFFYIRELVGILVGASLVSFMGIWDDRRSIRPVVKLLGQIAAAGILVASGVQVQFLPYAALNVAVTILWIVGITNAMNLLDNMDGLSGGIGAVASAFFFLLSTMSGQYLVGSLSAATLGACIGFLFSLFLGFMLAAVGIKLRFPANVDFVTWMIPVIVLWLPIFDTTLVVISRLRGGKNPLTTPGKDHVSHRLVAMGLTQREAVLVLYLICGALGVIAAHPPAGLGASQGRSVLSSQTVTGVKVP